MTARSTIGGAFLVLLTSCGDGPTSVADGWVEWIRENGHTIASLTSEDYSDLQFLKPILANRRIVQIGESRHYVAEYHAVNVRLVKFLHEEMGYDVIAFESSLYECFAANEDETLSPSELMDNSVYGVWRTRQTLPLFQYIQKSRLTETPLVLAGFDMKSSSLQGIQSRPVFLSDVVSRIDAQYAQEVGELDQGLVEVMLTIFDDQEGWDSFMEQNYERLSQQYFVLVDFLDQHEAELQLAFSDNPTIPRVARQTAWSVAHELLYYNGWIVSASDSGRDSLMAENIEFLEKELYPDKKIIVWAHNGHIRHSRESQPRHPMGTWLLARYRPELYTVGLYAYELPSGHDSLDGWPATLEASMEGILHRVGIPYLFVDMLSQSQSEGNSWMFETMPVRFTVTYEHIVPRDHYDAILYIDQVHRSNPSLTPVN
jgi:erythromycin esterase